MKLLIASDLHGSAYYAEKLLEVFTKEAPDKILLLGDLLYHGPRNDLPREYNPKKVYPLLNGLKDKIIAVRGNCDSEVDQMVLDFPMMADSSLVALPEGNLWLTHGHIFTPENPMKLQSGDVFLSGHTHLPTVFDPTENRPFLAMNPGSLSMPKEDSTPGYILYENGHFTRKSFTGSVDWQRDFPKKES